jgi:hypothetical protein
MQRKDTHPKGSCIYQKRGLAVKKSRGRRNAETLNDGKRPVDGSNRSSTILSHGRPDCWPYDVYLTLVVVTVS